MNHDLWLMARAIPAYTAGGGRAALPKILKFDVTYRCESRCEFCFYWCAESRDNTASLMRGDTEMSLDQVEQHMVPIVRRLGIRYVNISGGEPLLRTDLGAIVRVLADAGARVGLNTTLRGIRDDVLDALVDARARNVRVSIHGTRDVHDSLVQRPGAHDELVGNMTRSMARFRDAGQTRRPNVTFCYVVVPQNQHCILETVRLAEELGADRFYLHFLEWQPESCISQEWAARAVSSAPERRAVDSELIYRQLEQIMVRQTESRMRVLCHPFTPRCADEIRLWYGDPQFNRVRNCFFLWMETRIDPFGNVLPCAYLTIPSGNILDEDFERIWSGEHLSRTRSEVQSQLTEFCYKCCKLSRSWQNLLVHI